jgi:hypothetical protein
MKAEIKAIATDQQIKRTSKNGRLLKENTVHPRRSHETPMYVSASIGTHIAKLHHMHCTTTLLSGAVVKHIAMATPKAPRSGLPSKA